MPALAVPTAETGPAATEPAAGRSVVVAQRAANTPAAPVHETVLEVGIGVVAGAASVASVVEIARAAGAAPVAARAFELQVVADGIDVEVVVNLGMENWDPGQARADSVAGSNRKHSVLRWKGLMAPPLPLARGRERGRERESGAALVGGASRLGDMAEGAGTAAPVLALPARASYQTLLVEQGTDSA